MIRRLRFGDKFQKHKSPAGNRAQVRSLDLIHLFWLPFAPTGQGKNRAVFTGIYLRADSSSFQDLRPYG
ncbi:hypothetical protein EOH58_22225 [Salmonella enterica]|nr:hypothetical protein [Salmonella enterica]